MKMAASETTLPDTLSANCYSHTKGNKELKEKGMNLMSLRFLRKACLPFLR